MMQRSDLWVKLMACSFAALGGAVALSGCGNGNGEQVGGGDDLPPGARIVSLDPAISQMLIDMGLGDHIVGRNDRDPVLEDRDGIPAVASFATGQWQFQTEALLDRRPTHVLLASQVPEQLRTLAQRGEFAVIDYPVPSSVSHIQKMILDPEEMRPGYDRPARSLGIVFSALTQADRLKLALNRQLRAVQDVTRQSLADRDKPQPRVLVVLQMTGGGMTVSGRGSLNHELLTSWLHAVNAAAEPPDDPDQPMRFNDEPDRPAELDHPAPTLSRELLVEYARPDVIIILDPDGPDVSRPVFEEDPRTVLLRSSRLREAVPALNNERVVIINHPRAKLPSSSIGRIVAEMAKGIYPDLADEIDEAMEEAGEDLPRPDQDELDEEIERLEDAGQAAPALDARRLDERRDGAFDLVIEGWMTAAPAVADQTPAEPHFAHRRMAHAGPSP